MIALLFAAAVATAPAPVVDKADRKVCHKINYLGSRLNSASICKTKREWDEIQFEHSKMTRDQQMLDRALNNNG